jgi:hypothetical protein
MTPSLTTRRINPDALDALAVLRMLLRSQELNRLAMQSILARWSVQYQSTRQERLH